MPEMLDQFNSICAGFFKELGENEGDLIRAWEAREGLDEKDYEDSLAAIVERVMKRDPMFAVAVVSASVSVAALMKACFMFGWEMSKLAEFKKQFDA